MFSWESPEDRVAIVQMNAELRHAQLELLSAQCATHRLRIRFSNEDLARYAQRDTLRKAIDAASVLHEYYAAIEEHIPQESTSKTIPSLSGNQIVEATNLLTAYLQEQRNRYSRLGKPLNPGYKITMQPFFSAGLLDQVRIVELLGERLPNPSFYTDAKALGFVNLPEIPHMSSLTFIDVIVFNDRITNQSLFHGLVHAVQFRILGLQRYADAFIRGFLRTHSHVTVPLEAHSFALDSKFATNPSESFSVEEKVRMWVREGRY